ncbi:hypothetical protein AVEN_183320-1 [Araneus ventricosus]|uniref:Uncharacterized protein n=1 Tax=Araneus ventricosus TaxID=182803 RepID=A0A4Y2N278_ARAVE|nr:hypothetical protein AVEN_183320-1 [Araneus ventricosus]
MHKVHSRLIFKESWLKMPALDWWKKFKSPVTSLVGRGVATDTMKVFEIIGGFVKDLKHQHLLLPKSLLMPHADELTNLNVVNLNSILVVVQMILG